VDKPRGFLGYKRARDRRSFDGVPTFLVEAYAPGISKQTRGQLEQQARDAVREVAAEGRQISYLTSIFIREDETCFHLFEAASAEDVEAVSARAALSLTRIVEAV
jgi:hypothetical protein